MIDEAAASAARDRLTGRRFLDLEGPFGLGLTVIEIGNDDYCRQPGPDEAGQILGRAMQVPMIRKSFRISIRRVAAHLDNGQPLDLSPAQDAAEAVADREEELIYKGQPAFGVYGLLTIEGRQQVAGGDWSAAERGAERRARGGDPARRGRVSRPLRAGAGAGALQQPVPAVPRHRRDRPRTSAPPGTAGIYKAPIEGGVLVDTRVGVLVLGQDFSAGYSSQDGVHYYLYVSESIVLRIDEPKAICVIPARVGPAATP